ncbi:dihydrolipoyl dehydrogenase [Noviherbaspirillum cavernae]|uniref:Dihydrolipoyl dehydrogenase n=1 Tax=Noviherbaspirillum cavernae TaxID=2320862 RepID=A0A418X631_9BURK|nr:dihydrolipoyl dehydrogenase [Noviherbaspirillum cavernae]RJG07944.1 dihydrolipoyl dehydrogenase [Noviherbaspirillum cavernae]
MNTLNVDVAVIGAGTAGLAAYKAAKSHGRNVVLIEGGPNGTTCARVGCMPSKLLIAAADAAHAIGAAPAFGIHAGPLRIDGKAIMARVRSERDRFVRFVLEGVQRIPPEHRLRGYARFISEKSLQVDDHTVVNAASIVIATGSSPMLPPELADAADRLLVSDQVFEWDDLPESIAVIGAGVIGCELGQALHRLGVRVTIYGRNDRIAPLTDPAVRNAAARIFGDELDLRLHTEVLGAQRDGDGVALRTRDADGKERIEHHGHVLAASGRVPNLRDLDLANLSIALDERGVPLSDPHTMQCGDSGIFIAGDVSGERPLLHEAADEGRIAGDNAGRYPDVRRGLRRTPLNIVFCDPQIAAVGESYRDLQPGSFAVGEVSFEDQGRSRVMLQNRGLLRVYAEHGSGRFLGAEMTGPRAEHLAHLLAWACQNRMSIDQMLQMPFYHPVIEEGLRTALRDADDKLLHGLPEIEHCTDCTPGM